MKQDELNRLINDARDRQLRLTVTKGAEYCRSDDRLDNFKHIGAFIQPMLKDPTIENAALIVWLIYWYKHVDSLISFIQFGYEKSDEPVESRIDDLCVYLDLARGLVHERKAGLNTIKLHGDCDEHGGKHMRESPACDLARQKERS